MFYRKFIRLIVAINTVLTANFCKDPYGHHLLVIARVPNGCRFKDFPVTGNRLYKSFINYRLCLLVYLGSIITEPILEWGLEK